jgi:hypothetical protein
MRIIRDQEMCIAFSFLLRLELCFEATTCPKLDFIMRQQGLFMKSSEISMNVLKKMYFIDENTIYL